VRTGQHWAEEGSDHHRRRATVEHKFTAAVSSTFKGLRSRRPTNAAKVVEKEILRGREPCCHCGAQVMEGWRLSTGY
jgi:hypothetical protein